MRVWPMRILLGFAGFIDVCQYLATYTTCSLYMHVDNNEPQFAHR